MALLATLDEREGVVRLASLVGGIPEVVGPETPIVDVAALMIEVGRDAVAVVDRTGLIGICTARDLVRAAATGVDPATALVSEWMTTCLLYTSPSPRDS